MFIVLGATGHVGSAVAANLLERKKPVTVLTHDTGKESYWKQKGATVNIVDVLDTNALRTAFSKGTSLFLLNPPGDPSKDNIKIEEDNLHSIITALLDSPIKQVVAESTYGAQPGARIGDLGVLFEMEFALQSSGIYHKVIRGAYYMSNWDASLKSAREEGVVHTLYPVDFKLPMVAPRDIGELATEVLLGEDGTEEVQFIEGPQHYSAIDVAAAFSKLLGK